MMNNSNKTDNPSQPVIDPGERAIAQLTLWPFILDRIERIRAPQLYAIQNMSRNIAKLAKELVTGQDMGKPPTCEYSYDTLLDRFSAGIDQPKLQAMAGAVNDADMGLGIMRAVTSAFDFLSARMPRVLYSSGTGVTNLEPPINQVFDFQDAIGLLAEPLGVFCAIADGSLLPTHVEMYHQVYQSLFEAIGLAIDSAITDELAKKKSFHLPAYVEFGLAVFRYKPISAALFQDAYIQTDANRQAQPSPSQSMSVLAKESASSTESAVYKQAGAKS